MLDNFWEPVPLANDLQSLPPWDWLGSPALLGEPGPILKGRVPRQVNTCRTQALPWQGLGVKNNPSECVSL